MISLIISILFNTSQLHMYRKKTIKYSKKKKALSSFQERLIIEITILLKRNSLKFNIKLIILNYLSIIFLLFARKFIEFNNQNEEIACK